MKVYPEGATLDFDELWKRASGYLIKMIDEPMYDRIQAAAYLGVPLDTFDYYVRKLPPHLRLNADLKEKDGRTYKNIFLKSTLDKFKTTIRPQGRPAKVQNDE